MSVEAWREFGRALHAWLDHADRVEAAGVPVLEGEPGWPPGEVPGGGGVAAGPAPGGPAR